MTASTGSLNILDRAPRKVVHAFRLVMLALVGSACGSAQSETSIASAALSNVVPLTVRTPNHGFNRMVISVAICEPGSNRCVTIDNVMVDTGATGLRLEAASVPSWMHLPRFIGPDRKPLAECLRYVHDTAWGSLHRADLHIGGMVARDLPMQIIGTAVEAQPDTCPTSDGPPTSNGTLGIGVNLTDCQGSCEQSGTHPGVFVCDTAGCVPVRGSVAPSFRLPNPVSSFAGHDNGVVFDVPAAPPEGAKEVVGTLTFGVNTGGDHRVGPASIVQLGTLGRFVTRHGGLVYPDSTIDSGTPTNIVPDVDMPRCIGMAWALCAEPPRRFRAEVAGIDGPAIPVFFQVGRYDRFLQSRFGASDGVAVAAESGATAFVWGAPFFFGKRVAVLMEGQSAPGLEGVRGPLYAFEDRP